MKLNYIELYLIIFKFGGNMDEKKKKLMILFATIIIFIAFFFILKNANKEWASKISEILPLPVFTAILALVDGFNPCNLFVLTMLISLLLSKASSKKIIYIVGYTFIFVVFIFYFLFMSLWLRIFDFFDTISWIRIIIGLLAIIAGFINIKELFFYRKGITLMVQDKHVKPLKDKINWAASILEKGSIFMMIGASILLGFFSSLVELPCTAGFPIVFTGILSERFADGSLIRYGYLILYNLFYILPLAILITVLGYSLHCKQIKKNTMAVIKYVGGMIMTALGIVLIFFPSILGL